MKTITTKPVIYLAAFAAFALCAYQTKTILDNPDDPIYKNVDASVKPGDDFFMYANGTWIKNNPIPPAYSSWGIGNIVTEEIRNRLKKVNEDAMKANAAMGTTTQKLADFYYTGLDSAGIEDAAMSPLLPQLAIIEKAKSPDDILNAAALLT
ncbi:MAG: M13 family peptidase, partial [Mucilaginibacter sp.]